MKLCTTPDQTAKLIELGFEKPSSIASVEPIYGMGGISIAKAYSIGELIEFLPKNGTGTRSIEFDGLGWIVDWDFNDSIYQAVEFELIDAIYGVIIKLKEKGVI